MLSVLDLIPKVNGWIWLLRILSPLVFLAGATLGLWNVWVVTKGSRGRWAKLWAVLLAAALLTLLWAAVTFHLISFHTGF
jgi:hypothetical protein